MELIVVQDMRYDDSECIFPDLETCLKDCSKAIDDLIFYEFEVEGDAVYTEIEPILALDMIQNASENRRIYGVNIETVIAIIDRLSKRALQAFDKN